MRTCLAAAFAHLLSCALAASAAEAGPSDAGPPFGTQKLLQEIDCAAANKDLLFMEFPAGASKVEKILGTPCRVLPNKGDDPKYFAYRIAEGKGLKAGGCYVLSIEFPDDQPRAMWVCNWGCETALGFATGTALGDVLKGKYVPNNPESLHYPLSGKLQRWTQLFYLHDRFPEIKRHRGLGPRPLVPADGFWVAVAQPPAFQDPLSAGAAVSKIRLFEVADPAALAVKLHFPPDGLPRRHVFSREEMADGVVAFGHKPEEQDDTLRGVKDIAAWHEYKMKVMAFLGINTYAKDLLEFGHNQGWDSAEGGGSNWVNQSSTPWLWAAILERAAKHGVTVLPYYEYRGSIGQDKALALGSQSRCKRLDGGDTYTHISWCEGKNADITDPDTVADAKKILDHTITKYKDKVKFVGAWFRQRPTAMPISFNEANLRLFAKEANDGTRISRSHLQNDKPLLGKYYQWWFGKRRQFLEALRDHLRATLGPEAFLLYTNDTSEPGRSLPRSITGEGKPNAWQWMQVVVTDDFPTWEKILTDESHYKFVKPYAFDDVVSKNMHARGLATFHENWAKWEMSHASPPNDPQTYKDADGVLLTYTCNRLYTVSSPKAFDDYRTKSGLAIVRHYSLNENEMNVGKDEPLGYFICDVERSGPYCMMAEARAVAYGDPWYLGSLTGNSNHRGFPEYVRAFHAAFLALPALPSEIVPNAASDPDVVVRAIRTPKHGTYLAIVNTGFAAKSDVAVALPAQGKVEDAATGQPVPTDGSKLTLSLRPAELRALRIP
ncbi:MAG TPA: hypothetical protein VNE39_18330 [Planctomycetota bacterium]|nr:hypothetical protein [Planctomycetota bacterium]